MCSLITFFVRILCGLDLNRQAEGVEHGGGDGHVDDHADNVVCYRDERAGGQRGVNFEAL